MTPELFERLLKRRESTLCDFKLELTLPKDDKDKESNFIKDIVALANTIRKEDAYIIIGVEEIKATGELIPKGIQQRLNDATLQDKIKDKIRPRPSFEYYEYKHTDNNFYGIIKVHLIKYDRCLTPIQTVKQNVLERDKIYYRGSTQNQEATPDEIIRISNWFKSPYFPDENSSKPIPYSTKEIQDFINALKSELEQIDLEAKWSNENFVELDVEIIQKKKDQKSDRKVKSLLEFIKKEKASKSFLLLGEAGAGKSVALRKLSKDLLNQKEISKIPIYLNLRDLRIDLNNALFPKIKNYLYSDYFGNDLAKNFIQIHFENLYKEGKLFFILDSFDENITVIDELDGSEKIDKISKIINDLVSANNQVILASREFKKPTEKFLADNTLEILPLSREKTLDFFKSLNFDKQLLAKLDAKGFKPLTRNPFTATLIKEFYQFNQRLPQNQFELYDNFIQSRLNSVKNKNLENNQIIDYTKKIADVLSENQGFGLDISITELQNRLPLIPLNDLLSILKQIRLIRTGSNRFSFTHKRFYEYFIALGFQDNSDKISIEDIPLDKRRVDAIALYCEIANEDKAKEIIGFCWNNIQSIDNQNTKKYQYGISCLKFLANAFKARTKSVEYIENELSTFILDAIESDDVLLKKYTIRCASLLIDNPNIIDLLMNYYPITQGSLSEEVIDTFKYFTDSNLPVATKEKLILQLLTTYDTNKYYNRIKELTHYKIFRPVLKRITFLKTIINIFLVFFTLLIFQSIFHMVYESFTGESNKNMIIEITINFVFLIVLYLFYKITPIFWLIFNVPFIFYSGITSKIEKEAGGNFIKKITLYVISFLTILWVIILSYFMDSIFSGQTTPFHTQIIVYISILFSFVVGIQAYISTKKKRETDKKHQKEDNIIYKAINALYESESITKKFIETDFQKFKTSQYRLLYIYLIKKKTQNYIPEGEWTDGKRPYHSDNDPASILLAELDEKWLSKK